MNYSKFYFNNHKTCSFSQFAVASQDSFTNIANETTHYKIVVKTGDIRGSGTEDRAWIQLIGEYGATSLLEIGVDNKGDPCGF